MKNIIQSFILLSALCGCATTAPAPNSHLATEATRERFIAACETQAKGMLKAPLTAKFNRGTINGTNWLGQAEYFGTVDSQNSFGAMIRSTFQCLGDNGTETVFFMN